MDQGSRFLAVSCVFLSFTWVCSLDEFTIYSTICRDEHLGIDANTSQLCHISRVTVSFRSLMRM